MCLKFEVLTAGCRGAVVMNLLAMLATRVPFLLGSSITEVFLRCFRSLSAGQGVLKNPD